MSVEIDYSLKGGSLPPPSFNTFDEVSDIGETITLFNRSATALDLHFFQYSDFDLWGTLGGDVVALSRNSLTGLFNQVDQTKDFGALSETVVTPGATHGEAGFFNQTLSRLNDANPTTLNDNTGPIGPGDVTWALEWDLSLAPGESYIISKDKHLDLVLTPEPSASLLLPLGLLVGFWRPYRDSLKNRP